MKKYVQDTVIGWILAGLGTFLAWIILTKMGYSETIIFSWAIKGTFFVVPVLILITWFYFIAYQRLETIRRSNALIIKTHAGHWAHLSAIINSYIELEKLKASKDVTQLKSILETTYFDKYKEQLVKDLQKLYPHKTKPQIEKLVNQITEIQE